MCSVNFIAVCRLNLDISIHTGDDGASGEVRQSFAGRYLFSGNYKSTEQMSGQPSKSFSGLPRAESLRIHVVKFKKCAKN